tara:strand:- start:9601 stop:10824 length:1224 start_codon:yes stop_codon:yes gene_type:complete
MSKAINNQKIQTIVIEKVPCAFAKPNKEGGYGTHYVKLMLDDDSNIMHLTNECAEVHDADGSAASGTLSEHTCSYVLAQIRKFVQSDKSAELHYAIRKSALHYAADRVRSAIANRQQERAKLKDLMARIKERQETQFTAITDVENQKDFTPFYNTKVNTPDNKIYTQRYSDALGQLFNRVINTRGLFRVVPILSIKRYEGDLVQRVTEDPSIESAVPRAALTYNCKHWSYYHSHLKNRALAIRMSDGTWWALSKDNNNVTHTHHITSPTGDATLIPHTTQFISADASKQVHVGGEATPFPIKGKDTWMVHGNHTNRNQATETELRNTQMSSSAARATCAVCRKKYKRIQRHLNSSPHVHAVNRMFFHGLKFTTRKGIQVIKKYGVQSIQCHKMGMEEFLFGKTNAAD